MSLSCAAAPVCSALPLFPAAGYELTDSGPEPQAAMAPAIALVPGGASLGLQGSF